MSLLSGLTLPDLISLYGYWAVFAIMLLESAGLPLPGETAVLLASAYAGTTGELNIVLVVLAAATGAILGDNLGYLIGRRYGFPLLLRHGSRIGLHEGRLKLGQYLFLKHGGKIVFFGRFTPLLRTFAAVLAGANAYSRRRFFVYNASGGLVWAAVMGSAAYWAGRSVEHAMGPASAALIAVALTLAVAGSLFVRRHEQRLSAKAELALPGPLSRRLLP
jgi:membrane protein DedA with SNARE-associated domain